MNSVILFVGFLLAAVTVLSAGLLLALRRLRNAEDALDARFDENGNFIYPGRIRNWELDPKERVLPLGEFRGCVSGQPSNFPRTDTGD